MYAFHSTSRAPRAPAGHALALALALAAATCAAAGEPGPSPAEQAWAHYRMGEFNTAARHFKKLADSLPDGSDAKLEALYGLGCAYGFRSADPYKEKAAECFDAVAASKPGGKLAPWCKLALIRLRHLCKSTETPDYDSLERDYMALYDAFPEALPGQEAFLHAQAIRVARQTPEAASRAREDIAAFARRHPNSGFISLLWEVAAEACAVQGDADGQAAAAVSAFQSMEMDPRFPVYSPTDIWRTASIAEFVSGDFETARKYYQMLIDTSPTDMRVFSARLALRRMDEIERRLKAGEPLPEPFAPPTPPGGTP